VSRILVVVLLVVAALFLVELLASYNTLLYYAGRLSFVLFLAGSIWCFGFLLLRTENQAATESYDLQRATLTALHSDDGSPAVEALLARYAQLSRRHWEITQTRSHSAALTLYGTISAALAGLCVLAGFPGAFWALFDFFAVVLFAGALLIHMLGQGRRNVSQHVDRLLPARWRSAE
jgi:hypothetical protein